MEYKRGNVAAVIESISTQTNKLETAVLLFRTKSSRHEKVSGKISNVKKELKTRLAVLQQHLQKGSTQASPTLFVQGT